MNTLLKFKSLCKEKVMDYTSDCNSYGSLAEDRVEEALLNCGSRYMRSSTGSRADVFFKSDFVVFAEHKHIVLLQVKAGKGLKNTQPVLDRHIFHFLKKDGYFVSRAIIRVANVKQSISVEVLENLLFEPSRIVKEVVV